MLSFPFFEEEQPSLAKKSGFQLLYFSVKTLAKDKQDQNSLVYDNHSQF
jgi:hypothetical protein